MIAKPTDVAARLKVVHYLSAIDLRDGGVVRAVLDLCDSLVRAGQAVTLLTLDDRDVPKTWAREAWRGEGVPSCVKLPGPTRMGGLLSSDAIAMARGVIDAADAVHLHAMWIPSNEQLAGVCRKAGTPVVWSPHGMLDDWCMAQKALKKRVYHALFARRAMGGVAAMHCTAEAELAQASKWFGRARERGVVIPLPFELGDYRNLPGPEQARAKFGLRGAAQGEATLLFLSRLHPKKGVEVFLRAGAAMRDAGRAVKLVIGGGGEAGYERSLHELAAELKLTDRVVFAGFVKGMEKVSLYQAADVFVLPSSQENFGYVVVEAMAAGTPVVTTRGVALWPQLERERVAVLAEPTVEGLLGAITPLLDDATTARELGRRGREWCLREMDPDRIIAAFVELYRTVPAKAVRA